MTIATYSVTTATGNAYTSSGNTAITSLTLCNWSAGNITANLFVVPSGGSAGTSNQMLYSLLINSGDTYQIYSAAEKIVLANGDSIRVNASANSITAITSYTSV